jgi:hypothetical protein
MRNPHLRFSHGLAGVGLCAAFAVAQTAFAGDEQALCLGYRPAGQTYPIGARIANGLAAVDLDGDGLKELLVPVAEENFGGVQVFPALPGFRYAEPVQFELSSAQAVAVSAGDFNGDGKPDLVFLTVGGDVVILFTDGRGGFGDPAIIVVGSPAGQLLVADFDGDGRPDVAVTHGDQVTVLYDPSPAGAEAVVLAAVGATALAMTSGDFDGDARPDLAIATPHGFSVLLNGGGRSLRGFVAYDEGTEKPLTIAAGDLNGDGLTDLVLAAQNFLLPGTVNVWYGDGNGGFLAGPRLTPGGVYAPGGSPIDAEVADLNGDGRADVVVLEPSLWSMIVLLQTPDGGLAEQPPVPAGAGARLAVPADLQSDGITDVSLLAEGIGEIDTITILPGIGGGAFDPPPAFPAPEGLASLAVADFDGDGNPDLALGASDSGSGALSFLRGDGRGSFEYLERPGDQLMIFSLIVKAADFDLDGRPDLLVGSQSGSRLYLYVATGPLEFAAPEVHDIDSPEEILIDDFNRDGLLDVLVVERGDRLDLLLGAGPGKLQERRFIDLGPGDVALTGAVADLDGDGNPDVLLAAHGGHVWLLRGRGDGTFDSPVLAFDEESDPNVPPYFTSTRVPSSIAVGDYNGDGILDLALSDENIGWIDIAFGAGDGTFQLGSQLDAGTATRSITAIDWDRDGILDLAVARLDYDFVTILIGAGDGTFRKLGDLPSGGKTVALAAADLDGDGRADLAAANAGRASPFGGSLPSTVTLLTNHCGDRVRIPALPIPADRQPRTVGRRPGGLPPSFD